MKAVFHTGLAVDWGDALDGRPWCLASVGGKPLVEHWLEWAVHLGIKDIRLVLGDGADEIEGFCGDGSRWGLQIAYGFLRQTSDPEAYLRRSPRQWEEGLLYIAGPVFPRRLRALNADGAPIPLPLPSASGASAAWMLRKAEGRIACFLSRDVDAVSALVNGTGNAASEPWTAFDLDPVLLDNIRAYYELNMRLAGGEIARYVRPGFGGGEGACIGSNVIIPPSAELRPPLIIGDNCRIHPMAVIGPAVVIGNGVIVDRQTELTRSVVLDDTYLGRNLEIRDRVVAGARLVDPSDGTAVDIADPWLLAPLEAPARASDLLRAVGGWVAAVVLTLVQAIPFCLFYLALRASGKGRFQFSPRLAVRARVRSLPCRLPPVESSRINRAFTGLSLDLFPLIALAAMGRLWLCGHAPLHPERDANLRKRLRRYYPAAFGYHTARTAGNDAFSSAVTADAFYYERYRSAIEDLRILCRTLFGRLLACMTTSSGGAL